MKLSRISILLSSMCAVRALQNIVAWVLLHKSHKPNHTIFLTNYGKWIYCHINSRLMFSTTSLENFLLYSLHSTFVTISTNHVIHGTRLLYQYKSGKPNNLIRLLLFFVASSSKQNTIMRRCARVSNSPSIVGNTALQALELTAQIKRLTNGQIINNIRSMRDDRTFHTSMVCLS